LECSSRSPCGQSTDGSTDELDQRFLRVHHSAIVNTEGIKELHPYFNGEYAIVLFDGVQWKSSRGYSDHLRNQFWRFPVISPLRSYRQTRNSLPETFNTSHNLFARSLDLLQS
jgi:hypothetical protein